MRRSVNPNTRTHCCMFCKTWNAIEDQEFAAINEKHPHLHWIAWLILSVFKDSKDKLKVGWLWLKASLMGIESIKKEPIEEDCDAGVKHRIAKGPFLLLFCVFSELELTKRTHRLPYPWNNSSFDRTPSLRRPRLTPIKTPRAATIQTKPRSDLWRRSSSQRSDDIVAFSNHIKHVLSEKMNEKLDRIGDHGHFFFAQLQ